MALENPIAVPNVGTGSVRTVQATVLVAGVPTNVEMQVVALADSNGVPIDDVVGASYQLAMLRELREIRTLLAAQQGALVLDPPLSSDIGVR
jgi:hypothetical protein